MATSDNEELISNFCRWMESPGTWFRTVLF